MKTFYTERDIEEMVASGVIQLEVNDNVVLTDLAREKAEKLGLRLVSTLLPDQLPRPGSPPAPGTLPPPDVADLVARIKTNVIARLGTNEYNGLLDQIIPQVLARLKGLDRPEQPSPASDKY